MLVSLYNMKTFHKALMLVIQLDDILNFLLWVPKSSL